MVVVENRRAASADFAEGDGGKLGNLGMRERGVGELRGGAVELHGVEVDPRGVAVELRGGAVCLSYARSPALRGSWWN